MSTTWHEHRVTAMNGSAPTHDERSLGEIFKDLNQHMRELVSGEVTLAKQELTDNAKQAAVPAAMGVAAVPFALAALLLLGDAIAETLNRFMAAGLSYLITALVYLAIAGALGFMAKKKWDQIGSLAPKESIETAKEDVSWIKTHAR